MIKLLQRFYIKNLIYVLIFVFILMWIYSLTDIKVFVHSYPELVPVLLFTVCAVCGLGWPLLFRSYYAHRQRHRKSISQDEFIAFQKKLIIISLLPVYFLVISIIVNIAHFYQYGILFIAMYTGYYYYPFRKRIILDQRIYRVTGQGE